MALNIPNVDSMGDSFLKGIDTGSTLFTRMMQPVLEREKQKQLEAHFQEQLKLDKMANARQALAAADAHKRMDPMYEINQYKALENWVKGRTAQHAAQQQAATQNGGQMPDLFGGQQPNINLIPKNKMGLNQDSMNNLMSSGLNKMPEVPNVPTFKNDNNDNSGGIDLDLLKAHPMLRGFAKKHLGYDPLEQIPQTPEEKEAMALDLFKKKQDLKKGATGDNVPLTTAMQTKLQGVVTGVDNSLPVIEDLIKDFKNLPTGSEMLNPSAYADYNAKANSIIEPLINAFGLNITDATKDMMHDQVFRKTNEPLSKYRNRLVHLAKEIIRRRDDSFKNLKSGSINPKSQYTSEYFGNLEGETKELNGKKYQKINGEWHEVK